MTYTDGAKSVRETMWKKCTSCKQWKLKIHFSKDRSSKDGLHHRCKDCDGKLGYKARKATPDKFRNRACDYRKTHQEYIRDYTEKNQEKLKEYNREYYLKNKDKELEKDREWRDANKGYMSIWRKNNPDKNVANKQNRRAREIGNGGYFTAQEWKNLKEFYKFICLRCGRKEPEIQLTPDHILPISKGGGSEIKNIQPLCKSCNSSKNNKNIDYRRS